MNNAVALPRSTCTTLQLTVIISLCIILLRLMYLQLYCFSTFTAKSQKNFTRHALITPERGNIRDCEGNLLVTNRPVIHITWHGTGKRRLTAEQQDLVTTIERITNVAIDTSLLHNIMHAERYRKTQIICEDITIQQLATLLEQYGGHANIGITTSFKRHYPYQNMACHILGYINHLQDSGQMGLEKLFDDALRGKYGTFIHTINSTGRSLATTSLSEAIGGDDVTTTLSLPLQLIAEQVFPDDEAGALLVMEPETGALRVVLSRPNFDPSLFIEGIDYDTWQKLSEKKPFINRAFNACYPPASLFKLISIAAALQEGIIDADATWYCKGYITFGRRTRCNKQHGWVDVIESIAQSCNILFYDIGKQLSIDTLAQYAHMFGLGHKTGVLFPEKAGLVPTAAWKQEQIGERWWPGETLSAAIGQTYLLVTPLQIATLLAGIFTGQRPKPRLLPQEPIEHTPLDIPYATRRFLQKAMRQVVKIGKAKMLNDIDDIKGYAKTGTAQTSGLHKRFMGKKYRSHAWLAGSFSYQNEPPIILVVLLESTGSSITATRVAKQFLIKYRNLKRKASLQYAKEHIC